jgi:hypothetical protein
VNPGRIYSITTTTGQGKGTASGPAGHRMALPYTDTFDGYAAGQEARYLSDMDGAFEVAACGGGRPGMCVRQMANQEPVEWRVGARDPSALLQTRVGTQAKTPANVNAYFFRVSDTGAWSIVRSGTSRTRTLASGTAKALGTGRWHTLALSVHGSTITAAVDGTTVHTVTDGSYTAGQVGIGTSQTINVQFDNLSVTPN